MGWRISLIRPYQQRSSYRSKKSQIRQKTMWGTRRIESGFVILNARWRCLLKQLDSEIENVSNAIITCVVLHNMCQFNGDQYLDEDEFLEQALRQEREARQRRRRQSNANPSPGTNLIRHALESYIDNNY